MSSPGLTVSFFLLGCVLLPAPASTQDLASTPADAPEAAEGPSAAEAETTASVPLASPDSFVNAVPVRRPDFNDDVYYRNKLEFSLNIGVLPINIPFAFDAFVGDDYSQNPMHYTLVPIFASLRWQMGAVRGPLFLRGNTDLTVTGSITPIPRGPEKSYEAFDLGFRRNFVYRNWRVAPYFEVRLGAGYIDAQGPHGNTYAQGQDFTFTLLPAFGFRYNIDGRWSFEVGAAYMHVSNLYMSEPKYDDNGINVCGPWIGFNRRFGKGRTAAL